MAEKSKDVNKNDNCTLPEGTTNTKQQSTLPQTVTEFEITGKK